MLPTCDIYIFLTPPPSPLPPKLLIKSKPLVPIDPPLPPPPPPKHTDNSTAVNAVNAALTTNSDGICREMQLQATLLKWPLVLLMMTLRQT